MGSLYLHAQKNGKDFASVSRVGRGMKQDAVHDGSLLIWPYRLFLCFRVHSTLAKLPRQSEGNSNRDGSSAALEGGVWPFFEPTVSSCPLTKGRGLSHPVTTGTKH